MEELHNQVFAPAALSELFASWDRFPDAVPYAGGTEIIRGQGSRVFRLPKNILAVRQIEELRRITRTERYLEIGAAATLDEILSLGKIIPEALRRAIEEIATPQVRNLATLGGNVCCAGRRLDTFAPLVALDARFELRTATGSRWVAAGRFAPGPGAPLLMRMELLTRIRVPLETWNYTVQRRIGGPSRPDGDSAAYTFIARAERDILSDARVALAGSELVRDRSIENMIIGKALPLSHKDTSDFMDRWKNRLSGVTYPADLLKDRFLNLVEASLLGLSE